MKQFIVFQLLGSFSPVRKFETNNLEDARTMRNLLKKEDDNHEYIVCEVIE